LIKNYQVVEELKNDIFKAKDLMVSADYPKGSKKGWPRNFDGFISSGWC